MSRVRVNQISLLGAQWDAFIAAVKGLKASTAHPNYDDFALSHTHSRAGHQAHTRYTFLPWHREYLFQFEEALRKIDSTVTVPYWDWTSSRQIPPPLSNPTDWGVTRSIDSTGMISASRAPEVATALGQTNYVGFHYALNVPHGNVHIEIGGQMGDIENSPRDVLFWLHHAFLDKLWADWSANHPSEFPPDGATPETNVNARLQPTDTFVHTSRQVFNLSDLGYSYA